MHGFPARAGRESMRGDQLAVRLYRRLFVAAFGTSQHWFPPSREDHQAAALRTGLGNRLVPQRVIAGRIRSAPIEDTSSFAAPFHDVAAAARTGYSGFLLQLTGVGARR